MKQKIGFICIGQCGGNIGQILEQHGYNCIFVNTSKEDLSTLNVKYRYHIKNGEGCNHSRDKAVQLVKGDYLGIINEVQDKLYHQNLIYLVFSTGGGTGSGMAPILLEMLNIKLKDKYFGCITVLPSLDEPMKSQINSCKCYQEISNIEKLASVFTIDNNKLDKFLINNSFVSQLNAMLDIPSHTNTKGNIDKAEMWEMLTTRGNAIFTSCNSNNPSNLTTSIIKSWEQNIFADIEKDKKIVYLGLSLSNDINIDDLKKYVGVPFDIFKNYNRDQTITLLSGLTFPKTRIEKMVENLNINKDAIKNSLINSKTNKIDSVLDWIDDVENPIENDYSLSDIDSILSKYA